MEQEAEKTPHRGNEEEPSTIQKSEYEDLNTVAVEKEEDEEEDGENDTVVMRTQLAFEFVDAY